MEPEIVDIPEVFRRGMREWGEERHEGSGNSSGNNEQLPPPPPPRRVPNFPFQPWWLDRRVWVAGFILLLLLSFNWIIKTISEWLWFQEVGYVAVWTTSWLTQLGSFLLFFLVAGVCLLVNWRVAFAHANINRGQVFNLLSLPGWRELVTLLALFLAFWFGENAGTQWDTLLRYFSRLPVESRDPIFGQELGFYLFNLPFYQLLLNWFLPLLWLSLIGVVGLHLLGNLELLQRGRWRFTQQPILRRHLAILLTIIWLLWAASYRLAMFELLYRSHGVITGANYTDVQVRVPALIVQIALTLLLALATAVNIFRLQLRPLLAIGAALLGAILLGTGIIPAAVQSFVVEPNELALETPFIEHNIAATRQAFGLANPDVRPFTDLNELSLEDLNNNRPILQNVRIWDYVPLQELYTQLQGLRPYYQFGRVDVDRYQFGENTRQVMLATREMNQAGLTDLSWVNQRLVFTHGYGVVMNPVDQVTPEGAPQLFIRDLPPQATVPITITQPEIYYGEMMDDLVLVNSKQPELSYPSGSQNVYSHYAGTGGIPLSNFWRRLVFAIRFADINLLLSQYINPETRLMIHRPIRERVQQIAPFLIWDRDPYIVVADGRLVWMLDGYTTSHHYPYATAIQTDAGLSLNYVRNAVKATIDAYDGTVTYYLVDETDPFIQVYQTIFPDLFRPLAEMPASLRAHIRYPEDLFRWQTNQFLTYHMTEPQTFYNREDLWNIPNEKRLEAQQPVSIEPYYVILALPGEKEAEFLLIQPYVPAGKDNMVAWIAARSDSPHYGELVVYELPKQELIFGPMQVEARIDQDPVISEQISLWDQLGSQVLRGNLIVIPLNGSFLYVEPLYLISQTTRLPELKRVIVASGNRVVMGETLGQALEMLVEGQVLPITSDQPSDSPTIDLNETARQLIQSANAHLEAAEAAQQAGDWATYGAELELLEQDLQQLLELSQ